MRLALTWIQPDDLDLDVEEADDCFVFPLPGFVCD